MGLELEVGRPDNTIITLPLTIRGDVIAAGDRWLRGVVLPAHHGLDALLADAIYHAINEGCRLAGSDPDSGTTWCVRNATVRTEDGFTFRFWPQGAIWIDGDTPDTSDMTFDSRANGDPLMEWVGWQYVEPMP